MLRRVFSSLTSQTTRDFEWLIVDDGSTDNTKDIVSMFITSADFSISYYYKSNGGKHTAYNLALEKAVGEYFMCLDSDDFLVYNAVEIILTSALSGYISAGIIALKSDCNGNVLSSSFPKNKTHVRMFDLSEEYQCKGEFTLVFRSDIARMFPFPSFESEHFISECVVYDQIDFLYEMTLVPFVITICEYQPAGYTSSLKRLIRDNPCGFCLYYRQRIDLQTKLLKRIYVSAKYHAFLIISGRKVTEYNGSHRTIIWLSFPIGLLFFCYYKIFR